MYTICSCLCIVTLKTRSNVHSIQTIENSNYHKSIRKRFQCAGAKQNKIIILSGEIPVRIITIRLTKTESVAQLAGIKGIIIINGIVKRISYHNQSRVTHAIEQPEIVVNEEIGYLTRDSFEEKYFGLAPVILHITKGTFIPVGAPESVRASVGDIE